MFRKINVILMLIIYLLISGCSEYTALSNLPTNAIDGSSMQSSISNSKLIESNIPLKIGWRFEKYTTIGYSEEEILNTDIYLIINSKTTSEYKLGSYVGYAKETLRKYYEINQMPKDTLIACISWYGGGGDYIYITKKNNTSLSVMWRYVDSSGGESEPIEIPEYKEVKQINIPDTKQIEISPLVEVINENEK